MAVVQISRIQVRRGQKNTGTGLPQLASGELAWAVDTQELFIGNGSVAEGSPFVGNSKILTTNDSILDLVEQYQYKKNDTTIQTGPDSNYPIVRSVQDRLDERVSVAAFGAIGEDGSTDDTLALQRAVDQLYLNPATVGLYQGRYTLELQPGAYTISSTIYIPSYVSIVGAGQGRTIIQYTGTGSAFEFIDDTSTIGNPVTSITNANNRPKHILMKGFTILLTDDNVTGLKLNAVYRSVFEDIGIIGIWELTTAIQSNSMGIGLYTSSTLLVSEENQFNRMNLVGLTYGVYAKQDILNNTITGSSFRTMHMGVSFGQGADLSSPGEQFGPRNNNVTDCTFKDINRQGIKVANGTGNMSTLNRFVNVGNDGSNNTDAVYGHIEFDSIGNTSMHDAFDRAADLATTNFADPYIGEVIGKTHFTNAFTSEVTVVQTADASYVNLFRLPLSATSGYKIDYLYKSTSHSRIRRGTMSIAVDKDNDNIIMADDYEHVGSSGTVAAGSFESNKQYKIATLGDTDWASAGAIAENDNFEEDVTIFVAVNSGSGTGTAIDLTAEDNLSFKASIVNDSILIQYTNTADNDEGVVSYTYRALS